MSGFVLSQNTLFSNKWEKVLLILDNTDSVVMELEFSYDLLKIRVTKPKGRVTNEEVKIKDFVFEENNFRVKVRKSSIVPKSGYLYGVIKENCLFINSSPDKLSFSEAKKMESWMKYEQSKGNR